MEVRESPKLTPATGPVNDDSSVDSHLFRLTPLKADQAWRNADFGRKKTGELRSSNIGHLSAHGKTARKQMLSRR
jgi:hypothetical protein